MPYKVFLVEDEVVTREGIRDNVDWTSAGFEFCGEAQDGEIGLPKIEATQPDVLITDIKMPFMDGLQLCKIVRERMPWVKIIILSGHDEFNFAQTAVKLGVSEYLLKPVSVQDMHAVLGKVAEALDQEREERENLKRLKDQIDNNLVLLREKFLLRLLMGAVPSVEAIEQSQELNLDIIANCYQVVLIKPEFSKQSHRFDYQEYRQVERVVSGIIAEDVDILVAKKTVEELALLVEGDNLEDLASKSRSLVETLRHQVEQETGSRPRVEMGSPQERLSDIQHSFTEALIKVNGSPSQAPISIPGGSASQVERLKLDQLALEHYLKTGLIRDFDEFFDQHLYSASEAAIRSPLVKHYYFMDIVLTVAQFVKELDGDVNQLDSQVQDLEDVVARVSTPQQIREETRKIFTAALVYRNSGVNHERSRMIHQAQSFIEENLADADISLHTVAATVNLSPSHFSVVFSQEVGENFRDYLTNARIKRAKELLRTTNLKCYQVAFQCGYNDPHYFSYVFKKNTGLSPQQFRDQSK